MITLLPFYREITDYDKEPIWVHNLKGFNYPLMLSQLYDTYARISIDKHILPMKDVKFLVNTDDYLGYDEYKVLEFTNQNQLI